MHFNVLNRKVHYWTSAIIAVPLAVIIATGIMLQLKKHWTFVQPPEIRGVKADPTLSLPDLLERVKTVPDMNVRGWEDVSRIDIRPDRGLAKVTLANSWEVQVDLSTGEVLQTAYRRSDLIESIHDGSFFAGDFTKLGLFLPAGIALLLLWIGGMWMWWVPIGNRRRVRRAKAAAKTAPAGSTRSVSRGGSVMTLFVACATSTACAVHADNGQGRQPGTTATSFTALVGHWTTTRDGDHVVVTADARQWDGQPRPDLAEAGKRLFPSPHDTFAANASAPTSFPIAVADQIADFRAGTLSTEFKLIGGPSDQIAGLIFDLRPNGEYLYLRYNTRDNNLALWRFRNGDRERVADGANSGTLPLDVWHPLTVTIAGSKISGSSAAGLTFAHDLGRPVTGRVGFWTKRDSITAFRNLRLAPAAGGETPVVR
ncbi:MAG TPA: PepSY domain-containing protein [Vicinamibacterales bacterium]|nr:PepSY domain-containing protein [Vicinamibacterales bacterium]